MSAMVPTARPSRVAPSEWDASAMIRTGPVADRSAAARSAA